MKKWLTLILTAVLALSLIAGACAETVGMTNPWSAAEEADILNTTGATLYVPEDAEDVTYSLLESEELGEMDCFVDGLAITARVKPAEDFEDISGAYYDWIDEEECDIGGCEGVLMTYADEDETVEVCLWFDAANGRMYSVSTSASDLDGFDLTAIAMQVYAPVETEAE